MSSKHYGQAIPQSKSFIIKIPSLFSNSKSSSRIYPFVSLQHSLNRQTQQTKWLLGQPMPTASLVCLHSVKIFLEATYSSTSLYTIRTSVSSTIKWATSFGSIQLAALKKFYLSVLVSGLLQFVQQHATWRAWIN